MNSYSLGSDSSKWWWASAATGAIGAAALGVILVLPTTGNAVPVEESPNPAPARVSPRDNSGEERQCFMFQSVWNEALNGPQPVCYAEVDWVPARPGPAVVRSGLPVPF